MSTSTAIVVAEPVSTDAERLALAGFLAGYTGLALLGSVDVKRKPADEPSGHGAPALG